MQDCLRKKAGMFLTTWDEMWALGDKAKEEGIALFTYPTTGYFDAFFYALMHETMGDDFSKALTYEDGIWDTEGAKQAFDIVAKLATYTEKQHRLMQTTTISVRTNSLYLTTKRCSCRTETG